MPSVSSENAGPALTCSRRAAANAGACASSANTTPGLVHCWPPNRVKELCSPAATAGPRSARAPGSTKTGLVLPISAYTGMGALRRAAMSISARPPRNDPVKPTAFTSGCCTRAEPISRPWSNSSEKTPPGRPDSRTASVTIWPVSSLAPGCAGCALTSTGLPPASAEAVSPPATEKARGKLLAPKTTTGPSGRSMERMSGLGGVRAGSAVSMRAATQEPSSTTEAKSRSCMQVRASSPFRRGSGRAVSCCARAVISAAAALSASAMRRSSFPRSAPEVRARIGKASLAAWTARSTLAAVAEWKAGSSACPLVGSYPWNTLPPAAVTLPAMQE